MPIDLCFSWNSSIFIDFRLAGFIIQSWCIFSYSWCCFVQIWHISVKFNSLWRTDRQTGPRTDIPSYRDARTHLIRKLVPYALGVLSKTVIPVFDYVISLLAISTKSRRRRLWPSRKNFRRASTFLTHQDAEKWPRKKNSHVAGKGLHPSLPPPIEKISASSFYRCLLRGGRRCK